MKSCFIYQPHGIGDILFVQKIVHHYKSLGYRIIFPIIDYYKWAIPYLVQDNVEFVVFTNDRQIIEPFDYSEQIKYFMKAPVLFEKPVHTFDFVYLHCGFSSFDENQLMRSKYSMSEVDYNNWQSYVNINRNYEKENELYIALGLHDGDVYTLINEHSSGRSIEINAPGKVVKMFNVDGYTLFDWIKVIEKANQIITIDTSIAYLVELYANKDIPWRMISRYTPTKFLDIPEILSNNWKYYSDATEIDF